MKFMGRQKLKYRTIKIAGAWRAKILEERELQANRSIVQNTIFLGICHLQVCVCVCVVFHCVLYTQMWCVCVYPIKQRDLIRGTLGFLLLVEFYSTNILNLPVNILTTWEIRCIKLKKLGEVEGVEWTRSLGLVNANNYI